MRGDGRGARVWERGDGRGERVVVSSPVSSPASSPVSSPVSMQSERVYVPDCRAIFSV